MYCLPLVPPAKAHIPPLRRDSYIETLRAAVTTPLQGDRKIRWVRVSAFPRSPRRNLAILPLDTWTYLYFSNNFLPALYHHHLPLPSPPIPPVTTAAVISISFFFLSYSLCCPFFSSLYLSFCFCIVIFIFCSLSLFLPPGQSPSPLSSQTCLVSVSVYYFPLLLSICFPPIIQKFSSIPLLFSLFFCQTRGKDNIRTEALDPLGLWAKVLRPTWPC